MENVKVEICAGTACYLLGSSGLIGLENRLDEKMRKHVHLETMSCQGRCTDERISGAPYVRFNGTEWMVNATVEKILDRIRELIGKEAY